MNSTDLVLLERWHKERDADAFAELVGRHSAMVYATCKRVLGNAAEAEDMAQECFVHLMRAGLTIRSSLAGWLHTLALRRSLDRVKSEKRRRKREERFTAEQSNEEGSSWDEVLPHIDEAIAELPDELRVPVIHRCLEGRTHEAIGRDLGVAESTVRHRVEKGLECIRASLSRRGVRVSATALVGLMAANLSEAAPPALTAALGKLAIAASGAGIASKTVTASSRGLVKALGSLAGAKAIAVVVVTVVGGSLGLWSLIGQKSVQDGSESLVSFSESAGVAEQSFSTISARQEGVREAASPAPEDSRRASAPAGTSAAQGVANPAPSAGGGVVTGRVYDAETGEGIVGVKVWAALASDGRSRGKVEPSDDSGRYRITGLAEGAYWVHPSEILAYPESRLGKHATVTVKGNDSVEGIDFAFKRGIRVSGVVFLHNGEPAVGADVAGKTKDMPNPARSQSDSEGRFELYFPVPSENLALLARTAEFEVEKTERMVLPKEGLDGVELRLAEPRTSSISGLVVDSAGRPMSGVGLHFTRKESDFFVNHNPVESDGAGSFTVTGLVAGTYGITLTPPGVTTWNPGDVVQEVEVRKGQALTGLRFVFGEKGGLAIAGRVVDTAGKPVPKARVTCSGPVWENAFSGNDGAFRVTGLIEGAYMVQVDHDDYTISGDRIAAGTEGVVLVMQGKGAIEGQVVRADTGDPLPEFEAAFINGSCDNSQAREYALGNMRGHRDPEGRFAFTKVYVGEVTVAARAPGFEPAFQTVFLKERETAKDIVLRLRPIEPLKGRVVNAAGEPVEDAFVFLEGKSLALPHIERNSATRTGSDGAFCLDSYPAAISYIGAYHPGYGCGTAALPSGRGEPSAIVIILPESGIVAGTVYKDGFPNANALVYVQHVEPENLPYTYSIVQDDGSYEIVGLAPGTVKVTASEREGFQRRTMRTAVIESGKTTDLNLTFQSGTATVEGLITVQGQTPDGMVAELSVAVATGEECFRVVAEPGGSYCFENVPAGEATLKVDIGFKEAPAVTRSQALEFTIAEGETVRKDLHFTL